MKLISICKKHFKDNLLIYILLSLVFMVGISSGAITINMIDVEQKKELVGFLESFIKVINEDNIDNIILVKQSFKNNLQTFIFLWFLGIVVVGIPLAIGLVFLRGFIIGFTVGLVVKEMAFKGFIFAIFSILPQNIIFIPWIIISSAFTLIFSIRFIKSKINKNAKTNYINDAMIYTLIMGGLFLVSLTGTLIEAYITPIFMRFLS